MTWHSFFNLNTMEERHLVAVYAVVLIVQVGYAAWMAWSWRHTRKPR